MQTRSLMLMAAAMLLGGLFATMNLFASRWSDVRWSINDVYMIVAMLGAMFAVQGALSWDAALALLGAAVFAAALLLIRRQALVGWRQFLRNMIPHHSMAVFLSRQQLQHTPLTLEQQRFLRGIVATQEAEIAWMKAQETATRPNAS